MNPPFTCLGFFRVKYTSFFKVSFFSINKIILVCYVCRLAIG